MAREVGGCVFAVKKVITHADEEWVKVSWCEMTKKTGKGARWVVTKSQPTPTKNKKNKRKRLVNLVSLFVCIADYIQNTFVLCRSRKIIPQFVEVKNKQGRSICTWIKRKDLPIEVDSAILDGKATWKRLQKIPQRKFEL